MPDLTSPSAPRPRSGFDRPHGDPGQGRSVVLAERGMIATSHPLAAQAGLQVLREGGTAADAAIAANAMLGVVEPMSCGIGGDLFALYWDAEQRQLSGLNASGRSPLTATPARLADLGHSRALPLKGPLSWSVPGCVDGWAALHARFGKRPWAELLAPAREVAERGFGVSEIIAGDWAQAAEELARWPSSQATFLPAGRAPRFGERFRNPELAATYAALAEQGPRAFYEGEIARQLDAFSQSLGGLLRSDDLARHRSDWVAPVSTDYRGARVWELPPNGQGLAALQMLNLLEGFPLADYGPGSAEYLHLLVEAKRLVYADRARYYADPQHYADPRLAAPPVEELLSKQYAAARRRLIDSQRAAREVGPGEIPASGTDTVYLAVVDAQRNCCSFIQSIFHNFGSAVAVPQLGFALQNRGASFALAPDHPNVLAPHKRPFHTIIPALVTRNGSPWLTFGVMGGDMQPQGHVQVLVNLIDFAMNVQQAGDAARVRHAGSPTPRGEPAAGMGVVTVESGIDNQVVEALRNRGHQVLRARGGFGGYQAIMIDPETNLLHGASEVRKDGTAVGF